jgi:2-methylcitrate dehydratase PrpD
MADRWLTTDTLFKYHAACYLTHAGIEATSAIMDEQRLTAAEVDQITLVVHPSLDDVCNIQFPTTGLEAKFSLRATQAFAVNGVDTTSVEAYEDGPVNKPEVQKFIDKVTVEFDESLATTATRATVTTTDGDSHRSTFDAGVPATDLAAQRHKLEAKFNGLAGPVLGGDHVTAVVDRLRGFADLADVSVGAILRR